MDESRIAPPEDPDHPEWLSRLPSEVALRFKRSETEAPCGGYCWEWTSAHAGRYGQLFPPGRRKHPIAVHRLVWECTQGPIPQGLWVLHHCDNPPCANPYHLFLGTPSDNVQDMLAKGRFRPVSLPGSANPLAKLSEEDVEQILQLMLEGVSARKLAERFGVAKTTIKQVAHRKSWRHVPHPGLDAIVRARPRRVGDLVSRKLNTDQVRMIHRLRREGMLHREIAVIVGIDASNVCRILKGDLWPHIKAELERS